MPLFGKTQSVEPVEEEKKEELIDLINEELSAEANQEIDRIVDTFIATFSTKPHKEMAIKYTVMPLG